MVNSPPNSSNRTRIGIMHRVTWGVALRAGLKEFAFYSPLRYNAAMVRGPEVLGRFRCSQPAASVTLKTPKSGESDE